jgi:hypothetical protein
MRSGHSGVTAEAPVGGSGSVAVDPDGQADGADSAAIRIKKLTSDGACMARWSRGDGGGEPSFPFGVAIATVGHVAGAERDDRRLQLGLLRDGSRRRRGQVRQKDAFATSLDTDAGFSRLAR